MPQQPTLLCACMVNDSVSQSWKPSGFSLGVSSLGEMSGQKLVCDEIKEVAALLRSLRLCEYVTARRKDKLIPLPRRVGATSADGGGGKHWQHESIQQLFSDGGESRSFCVDTCAANWSSDQKQPAASCTARLQRGAQAGSDSERRLGSAAARFKSFTFVSGRGAVSVVAPLAFCLLDLLQSKRTFHR